MTPLVFLLLPDKKKESYERAFGLLKQKAADLGYQLDPQTIQMDFEVAARSAARTVFPTSEKKGCFFHFTQCVWRRTQQLGLQVDYREDAEVTRFVRRCAVLPLVPTHLIDTVWLQTMADMPNDARCTQLADYMTINWLDGDLALHLWNHHDTDGPRTNNHLEGWHGRIKKLICKAHPNIYELLTFLLDEQKKNELNMVQYEAGQRLPPKKKKYEDMKRRFLALRDRLTRNEIDVINFADASSYLLKL